MLRGPPSPVPLLALMLAAVALVVGYDSDSYDGELKNYCEDLSPYYGLLDLDLIKGGWFGVEKIFHTKGEYKIEYNSGECFYIDIRETDIVPTTPTPYPALANSPYYNRAFLSSTEYQRTRNFILEWHESIWTKEYQFRVNPMYRGFWPTTIPDRTVDNMYRYFGGAIQVLRVTNNYLVLNFCMRLPYSKHFSVILSRNEHQLTGEDLAVIHNIFTTKHLPVSSLKRVCGNSAVINYVGSMTFLVILVSRWFL